MGTLPDTGNIRDGSSVPGSGRSLEEEMATHSSILAWEIPRTEEPGGLWSTGLQRLKRFSTHLRDNGDTPLSPS